MTDKPTPGSAATTLRFLTSVEVAELFRVDAKTVSRWAAEGRLPFVRTPGGRYRYPEDAVLQLLAVESPNPG